MKLPHPVDPAGRQRYSDLISRAAEKHEINPNLIHAVISAESGYNPRATSDKGAMGLMQLMPGTASLMGVKKPYDAAQNIEGGVKYLRQMLAEFQSVPLAIAAYNAGPGAVRQYKNSIPPYPETQRYVKNVTNFYLFYRMRPALL